jgi:hypothetical protein
MRNGWRLAIAASIRGLIVVAPGAVRARIVTSVSNNWLCRSGLAR